jgi:hypothetical protein
MSFNVLAITPFYRDAKPLLKKYPSLKRELIQLNEELSISPELGTPIGNGCYKIRLAIASKGKGKSGGARIITYVFVGGQTVYLLSIYDKSVRSSISNQELEERLKFIRHLGK